uniref:Dermal papilla derived protein n=1 Tax=Rhipicephalus appendiculatus TaxID=34631 RepID=A0A131YWQ0_RHIAP
MNNFVGHAVTGTFLFVFGTWWTFAAWLSYVRSRKNKQRYLCRCSYAVPGVNRKFSIEGMVKIISASVCIVADFSRIFRHDRSLNAESIQHHSIYAFFLLSGVVDVMYNVGFPFPPHADYAALLLAIASEGLMFHFHLQGKTLLNAQTHKLLVYTVAALGACLIAEMCRPRSVLASLGRAYFCLLHGTWLWQLAFILFNPLPGYKPWNVNSHMDSMLAASLFPWHMMALLIYAGALGVAACVVNRMCGRFCAVVAADAEEVGDLREALLKCGV